MLCGNVEGKGKKDFVNGLKVKLNHQIRCLSNKAYLENEWNKWTHAKSQNKHLQFDVSSFR